MDLATGAMGNLAPKLLQLLQDEYKLQKGVRNKIKFLSDELESINAALRDVAAVPPDQLDEQVKIWARQLREASYDMEDILDTFLVRVEGCPKEVATCRGRLKSAAKKMSELFTRARARHDIASAIEDIKNQLQVVAERRIRYTIDDIVSKAASSSAIDPRLQAMYQEATKLAGVDGAKEELVSMLSLQRGQVPDDELKTVSVHGIGGLDNTTLAKAVYDDMKSQFDCGAFVPVGRNPDFKKVFSDILIQLEKHKYTDTKLLIWDEQQLIDELRDFLGSKRYFIVVDDVWEKESWEVIRLALVDKNRGSRIIITTRNKYEVTSSCEVYNPKALSDDDSKRLFYTRIFGEGKYPDNEVAEVSDKILKKCGGIPLAIITMASLLVGKSMGEWLEVCDSTGFHDKDTMGILSFGYYDLPLHLRTCLLYVSSFPADHIIDKNSLIWRWIAEGFVHQKEGIGLFEVGEGYFNDLVNRSLIQAVESEHNGIINGCRVHDMVLDLLHSLSSEENFVTVLDNDVSTSSIRSARRLAHQKGTADARLENNRDAMEKMRSLIAFSYHDVKELPFWRFELLRVLYLEGVYMSSWHNSENLGNLRHLRYLGLKRTGMPDLPQEIGALKFLQTLHLVDNHFIKELPISLGQLTNLMCLHAWGSNDWGTRMPNGIIQKLTSLEELMIECEGDKFKELRNLSKLRLLTIKVIGMDQSMLSDLLQAVADLHLIESIKLEGHSVFSSLQYDRAMFDAAMLTRHPGHLLDAVMLPRRLRHLLLRVPTLSRFPSCIDPTSLVTLTHLKLDVIDMDEKSMQILGGLPELCHLVLGTKSTVTITNIAVDGCFQKLRSCKFPSSVVLFVLNEDSNVSFTLWNGEDDDIVFGSRNTSECTMAPTIMPNLQELSFTVNKLWSMRNYEGIYGSLGLDCLTSLQKLTVILDYYYCCLEAYMMEVEAGLRHAIDVHPSHPALIFSRINEESARLFWASGKTFHDGSEQNKVSGSSDDDVSSPVIEQQEDDG